MYEYTFISKQKSKNLHLIHSWGGGLECWVNDFCARDFFSENLILLSNSNDDYYGTGLTLIEGRSQRVIQSWVFKDPIQSSRIHHEEYHAVLTEICTDYDVKHIYVSSSIGHSLDVYHMGIPITKIWHDYYPFCVAYHAYFKNVCKMCNYSKLETCLKENPIISGSHRDPPEHWLKLRDAFFAALNQQNVQIVCPSSSVIRIMRQLDDRYKQLNFRIIEHGTNFNYIDLFGGAQEGRRLRIGIIGNLQYTKGFEIIKRIFPVARLIADFYFVGTCSDSQEFAHRWGSVNHGSFRRFDLTTLLSEYRLDLALFLSIVPETFCFTLSEVLAHNIVPCAWSVGSFVDRLKNEYNGFLIGPEDDDLIKFLLKVDQNRELVRKVARNIKNQPVRTNDMMIDDYYSNRPEYFDQLSDRLEIISENLAELPGAS
ncbi:MAG: glycosyltransferase [Deltaproteobacteria bacterium]|nr:glycosyltransferase [Deltaproteobacteria bacterium]